MRANVRSKGLPPAPRDVSKDHTLIVASEETDTTAWPSGETPTARMGRLCASCRHVRSNSSI